MCIRDRSKPVPLTEEEVRKLGVEKVTVEVHYAVGDLVNVIDGPLEGFSGTCLLYTSRCV